MSIKDLIGDSTDPAPNRDLVGDALLITENKAVANEAAIAILNNTAASGIIHVASWNAATNTPTIPAASVALAGQSYKVAVAGSTNIDGETSWDVGDILVCRLDGSQWDKIPLSGGYNPAAVAITGGTIEGISSLETTGDTGIADPNPFARFSVRKDGTDEFIAAFRSDLGANDRSMEIKSPVTDSAASPFRFTTSNSFAFEIDGTERLFINSASPNVKATGNVEVTGNLGVGESGALTKAHVKVADSGLSSVADEGMLIEGNARTALTIASSGTHSSVWFADGSDPDQGGFEYKHSSDALRYYAAGNPRIGMFNGITSFNSQDDDPLAGAQYKNDKAVVCQLHADNVAGTGTAFFGVNYTPAAGTIQYGLLLGIEANRCKIRAVDAALDIEFLTNSSIVQAKIHAGTGTSGYFDVRNNLSIGNPSKPAGALKALIIDEGTGPSGSPSGCGVVWVENGDLHYMGPDGVDNVVQVG